ncbi:MAG: lipopolysaccharide biosynthesis protein [Sphingomonadales bacterium]|nr:lipopolysaccharide biosynthesis protein [Sphingomonadales bacterium]
MSYFDRGIFLVRDTRSRRIGYAVIALIFAFLCLFPEPFVARAKIVPQDTSATAASTTNLLGALGAGSQSIGSLLTGGRPSNDLYLIIGRSESVMEQVIKMLNLVGPNQRYSTIPKAKLALAKKVDVHLLLGGVLEIETKTHSPKESTDLTIAYQDAISRQLAQFGRQIIINKERIVHRRFQDAIDRVARSEATLQAYRRANNLADPEVQLGAALTQRATADSELQAKEVELQTLRGVRGPEATEVLSLQTEIQALRAQIARTVRPALGMTGPNVAGLTSISTQYLRLYRDYRYQQSIYDIYQRSAEQIQVEELAAESASYIQIIDPSHIDAERHYNIWAVAALLCILLLAVFTEWYAPATGLISWREEEGESRMGEPRA